MANARLIHFAPMRKELIIKSAISFKQKAPNSDFFGQTPSISHEIWRLPKGFGLSFLRLAKITVERLFE